MRDYYETLGVARDADADAIKRAYRKLALQYHPDRNGGDAEAEERFKEATEAYEVLRDSDKRSAYDRYGHAGVKGRGNAGFSGFNFADALDIFMRDFGAFGVDDLFGGRAGRTRSGGPPRGSDLRLRLPLTLSDVALGVHKTLKVRVHDPCNTCAGSGAAPGTTPTRCAACGGAGEVRRVQRSFLGQLVTVAPCGECNGTGERIEKRCDDCRGEGVRSVEKTVEVDVPAGVSSGDYITLRGSGNAGPRGGARGNLLVVIEVEEDARFKRDGANLIHELSITFSQAALGTEIDVPTVDGTARLKIAAGTQSGHLLRMRGKGLPQLNATAHGDMIVRVLVWTPTHLSPKQEQIFRELGATEVTPPAPGEAGDDRGFWSRVKEALGGS
jgi:molecular chaperone DnaJ